MEYMILQIVSKESIFSMIDILFSDIKDDYKKLEEGEGGSDDECDDKNHKHIKTMNSDDDSEMGEDSNDIC